MMKQILSFSKVNSFALVACPLVCNHRERTDIGGKHNEMDGLLCGFLLVVISDLWKHIRMIHVDPKE